MDLSTFLRHRMNVEYAGTSGRPYPSQVELRRTLAAAQGAEYSPLNPPLNWDEAPRKTACPLDIRIWLKTRTVG